MTTSRLDLLEFLNTYCCNDGLAKVKTQPDTKIPLSVLHDIISDGSGNTLVLLLSPLANSSIPPINSELYPNLSSVTDTSCKVNSPELFTHCIQTISLIAQSDVQGANNLLNSLDYKSIMWSIITFLTAYFQDIQHNNII